MRNNGVGRYTLTTVLPQMMPVGLLSFAGRRTVGRQHRTSKFPDEQYRQDEVVGNCCWVQGLLISVLSADFGCNHSTGGWMDVGVSSLPEFNPHSNRIIPVLK
jgi:hypothetical protein